MFLFGWGGREWNFSYFHIWSVLLIVILSEMIHQIKLIYLLYFNGRSGRGFRRWQFLEEKHYKRAKADILTKNKMKIIFKKIYND